MWNREQIKSHAKLFLKTNYWTAFAVCLVATLLGASMHSIDVIKRVNGPTQEQANLVINTLTNPFGPINEFFKDPARAVWASVVGAISLTFVIVLIIFRIIVSNNIRVGRARYFLHAIGGDNRFDYLFSAFTRGEWTNFSVKLLKLDIIIFLWSLLLVIPGIVKGYQYTFVEYILAEHPEYSLKKAMAISTQMTNNDKFNLFVLDLSFIGWYILGSLAFGIGNFFVDPYPKATEATLYRLKVESLKATNAYFMADDVY